MTDSKAWQKFIAELEKLDVDFPSVQHAAEDIRAQLLQTITALNPIERAQVSSTWAKLDATSSAASAQRGNGGDSADVATTAPLRDARVPEMGVPLRQSSTTSAFGRVDSVTPSPLRVNTSSSFAPVLSVPIMSLGISGSDLASLLRTALDRGDCGTALPLATELLQTDPSGLVSILNEFLPQLSVDQLKTVLGIGGGVPTDVNFSALKAMTGSPIAASPSRSKFDSGLSQPFLAADAFVEMSAQSTLNGQPVTAGQVLTSNALQAQFGARFAVTCNGNPMKLPYCVQRGDTIVVRSSGSMASPDSRLL